VLAWTRDRRRAVNRAIRVWGELGTEAAGIRLEVEGSGYLESARPAVFVLNHQSGIDPILVCALLRHDVVGVAKAELRRNPLLGLAFAFAGAVFVDRSDREQALRALEPAVEALRSGLSLAIAPEGTRSPHASPGRFKKGAFRIAMAAKVPLVPIVIHDAGAVLPRGGWIMTAAPVRVTVHPPRSTDAWTLETLDREIEAVERLYAETLAGAGTGA
jgi:putative phosphoserine phosphatase/1-acylglycerol-3-phosphate O-acyltransferase